MINTDCESFEGCFNGFISLYEATCAKVNMMGCNESEEEQKLSESMKLCKITPTNVTKESTDFKEEYNSDSTETAESTEELNKTLIEAENKKKNSTESEESENTDAIELVEVTSQRNGAKIIFATDDFYGIAENILKDDDPVCNEHTIFGNKNKVDGWKTQKLRTQQENFVIIQLAGKTDYIDVICIDTTCIIDLHFSSQFSIQGGILPQHITNKYLQMRKNKSGDKHLQFMQENKSSYMKDLLFIQNNTKDWSYLISKTKLNPGYPSIRRKFFRITISETVTHLRLNIYPDGGIARLRAYGVLSCIDLQPKKAINLTSPLHNSVCTLFNEAYIGHPNNIIQLNDATSTIDGWLSRSRYEPDYNIFHSKISFNEISNSNFAVFKLAFPGVVTHFVIDTSLFTGNAPYMVRLQGILKHDNATKVADWQNIIPQARIKAGKQQIIPVAKPFLANFVKLIIAPDGGISRFRVFGMPYLSSSKLSDDKDS